MTPGARITSRHLNQLVLHEVHEGVLKQRDDTGGDKGQINTSSTWPMHSYVCVWSLHEMGLMVCV
jgi:hypothetical protein